MKQHNTHTHTYTRNNNNNPNYDVNDFKSSCHGPKLSKNRHNPISFMNYAIADNF